MVHENSAGRRFLEDWKDDIRRLCLTDAAGFLDDGLVQTLRLEDLHPAAEAQHPPDQFPGIGHGKGPVSYTHLTLPTSDLV